MSNKDGYGQDDVLSYFAADPGFTQRLIEAMRRPESDILELPKPDWVQGGDEPELHVRGKVVASYRADRTYDVQVVWKKCTEEERREDKGKRLKVKLANCTCPIGKSGLCTHVALILWKGAQDVTRTDCPAGWKEGASKQNPWFKDPPVALNDLVPSSRPGRRWSNATHVAKLSESLQTLGIHCPFVVLHKSRLVQPAKTPETLIIQNNVVQHLLSQYKAAETDANENEGDNLCLKLEDFFRLKEADIRLIEEQTRGHSNRHKWVKIRMGRITASSFHAMYPSVKAHKLSKQKNGPQRELPQQTILRLMMQEDNDFTTEAIQHGVNNEATALKGFEERFSKATWPCGLFLHPSGALGATPDGLHGANAILEVKCPHKAKDETVLDAVHRKKIDFLEIKENGKLQLKTTHKYYYQVQVQMQICNRSVCHFIVWTYKDLQVIHVPKNPQWDDIMEDARAFFFERLMPYVMSAEFEEHTEKFLQNRADRGSKRARN